MLSFKKFLLRETEAVDADFPTHEKLNPVLWDDKKLKPEVLKALKAIAKEFEEFLDSADIKVTDITFTGSLANYNYTKHSDIDVHLVVDVNEEDSDDCRIDLKNFFTTKKSLWNETHDIDVLGFPVELYVQLSDEEIQAGGIYSISNNKWVKEPKTTEHTYDKYAVEVKAKHFTDIIDNMVKDKSNDFEYIDSIRAKIWKMRKGGLEKDGEFSEENLAFKTLRNSGYIQKLLDYRRKVKTQNLSLSND